MQPNYLAEAFRDCMLNKQTKQKQTQTTADDQHRPVKNQRKLLLAVFAKQKVEFMHKNGAQHILNPKTSYSISYVDK